MLLPTLKSTVFSLSEYQRLSNALHIPLLGCHVCVLHAGLDGRVSWQVDEDEKEAAHVDHIAKHHDQVTPMSVRALAHQPKECAT